MDIRLQHKFGNEELNSTLELFVREIRGIFGEGLVSVLLYGSLMYDDLSPGYSDLDFLVVVRDDVTDEQGARLHELRCVLRDGNHDILAEMLEGEFVPRKSLKSPDVGQSYYWGTKGDRFRPGSSVRGLVAEVIHDRAALIYGENMVSEIPKPTRAEIIRDLRDSTWLREHGHGGGLHSVDFLLTVARFLIFIREGRLSSKSKAAEWGAVNAKGAWREYLPMAAEVRRNPEMASRPDVKEWLESLTEPIQRACDELDEELAVNN